MSLTTRQLTLATSICALWLAAGGCTDRVIGSGEYRCDTDKDCSWGWRCLVIAGGDKACVDTSEPTGGDALVIGSDGAPANDGGPRADAPAVSATCGDGVLQAGEDCDDGELNSRLPDAACRPDCKLPRCGDGVLDSGEQCDGQPGCSAGCEASNPSRLVAQPPALHFGAVGLGCGPKKTTRTLRLYSPLTFAVSAGITIKKLDLRGDCAGFSPQGSGGFIAAGDWGEVTVALEPKALGLLTGCQLVVEADDGELVVPLTAEVGAKDTQTDRFLQRATRKVDILFAIDPSGSMADERSRLMATAPTFAAVAAQGKLDFHLGSISIVEPGGGTEQPFGHLHGDPRYITNKSQDLIAEFKTRIDMFAGGGIERALDAIEAALFTDLGVSIDPAGCNACAAPHICVAGGCRGRNWGFRRPDASLEILVMTDEADGSSLAGADLLAKLRQLVNPLLGQTVRIHGLLPSKSTSCAFVEETPVWDALIPLAGGVREDVCANDFSAPIKTIAERLFGLRRQFFLNRPVNDAATIEVTVGGLPSPSSYDPKSNSVILPQPPADGAPIEISYTPVCP